MFVPVPNGVRVVHVGRVGNVEVINTIGVQNGDLSLANPVVASSLKDIAKSHGDAWRANVLPLLSKWYHHTNTLAYSLEDRTTAPGDAAYTTDATGAGQSNPMPLHTCMVVSFKTAKRGRTYEGRCFLSGMTYDVINSDGVSFNDATVANVQAKFNAYKAAVDPAVGHNGRLAVCSKGSALHSINPHVEPVTNIVARNYVGTQRRRLR